MVHLFLFSTEESATILSFPVLSLEQRPDEITDDMIHEIILNCVTDDCSWTSHVNAAFLVSKTRNELLEVLNDTLGLSLNALAVISDDMREMAETTGGALGDAMQYAGSDSGTYALAEAWGNAIAKFAQQDVFNIGWWNEDGEEPIYEW